MLYNWDAVQFALALREFDVAKHQPHPPGYLLYVALGRLLNASLGDPTLAYVALAMLFSAGSTFVLYALARRLYDRVTALVAASLLAVSPLFWFYGSVGLTYAGEAFAASVVAWFAYATLGGSARHLYWGALALGSDRRRAAVGAAPAPAALARLRAAAVSARGDARRWRAGSWSHPCSPGSCRWCG